MKYSKFIQQSIFFINVVLFFYVAATVSATYFWFWMTYAILFVGIVISAYYHRLLSHRSWPCPLWLERFMGIMTAGHALTPAISWVAVHRKHHRFADTDKDVHGPRKGHIKNLLISYYDVELKYAGKSLLGDKFYQFQLKYYWHIAIVWSLLWIALFGWQSLVIVGAYGYVGQVCLNWIGHDYYGPVNRPMLAPILAGEPYHLNHHLNPQSSRFGTWDFPYLLFIKWFERSKKV